MKKRMKGRTKCMTDRDKAMDDLFFEVNLNIRD